MRLPRSTGALSGALIVVLGIWGALIPFVGPYFDYSFGTNATWHYTADRLWLNIIPGAVAIVGGLLLILSATRMRGGFGGWVASAAGAWFVIGPAVSLTWEHGRGPIGVPLGGSTRQALELIGYFYGLGALIVALAAFATGRFASRPRLAEDAAAVGAAPPRVARAAPTRVQRTAGRRRRAWPFSRRGQTAPTRGAETAPGRGDGTSARGESVTRER